MLAWDLIELDGLTAEGASIGPFLQQLESRGFHCHRRVAANTWRIALPPTMEQYVQTLSKPSRRKMRTALKRLASSECEATFATTEADFDRLWPALVQLHERRRHTLGERECFSCDDFSRFLRTAAQAFRRAGALDLVCVSLAGTPVATELCFRGESTTFAYQTGVNPDALRENPGWLVNAASIQRAIELGQRAFDLCRGDNDYKRHMGAEPAPCLRIRAVPPRLRSQLWDAALVTQTTVKEWLKAGLVMTGMR